MFSFLFFFYAAILYPIKKITSNIEITRTSGFNASVCAKIKSATAVQKGEPFFSKTETKEKRESRNAKDANNVFPGRRRRGMRVVPSTSPSWNDVDARFVAKFSPQPLHPRRVENGPFCFVFSRHRNSTILFFFGRP